MTKKMSKEEKRVTELVQRRMKESRSTELLGFDVESVHAGRAIFRLDVRPHHKQIHGVVHGGRIKADARVLRAGRNFVVTECDIFNEGGSLAAKALLTFGATAGHSLQK